VVGEKLCVAATEHKTTAKNLAESKTAAIGRDKEIGQGCVFPDNLRPIEVGCH
jgi:hypothetical protein